MKNYVYRRFAVVIIDETLEATVVSACSDIGYANIIQRIHGGEVAVVDPPRVLQAGQRVTMRPKVPGLRWKVAA